ncbi:MAG: PEGA domain-containing protein [Myxococcales bacterium]|nr:PEGA domain-containing protein [Myxococcales bacterium]
MRRCLAAANLCLALLALTAGPAPARQPAPATPTVPETRRAAIWELKTVGLSPDSLRELVEALQGAGGGRHVELLSAAQVAKILSSRKVPADSPLPRVMEALDVDFLLNGTAAGLGEEISLDLRALDRAGAEAQRAVISLPATGAERAPLLDEFLVRLLAPGQWTGALEVVVYSQAPSQGLEGAQVWLDGTLVGSTPLPGPLARLMPGKHIVMITKEGFRDFSTFVAVTFGKTIRLEVDLANATVTGQFKEEARPAPVPAPPPPPRVVRQEEPSWSLAKKLYLSGVIAGALLLGCGGALWLWSEDVERKIEYTRYDAGAPEALDEDLARGRALHRAGLGLVIGGAALAAGSLVLFLITGDEPPAQGVTVVPRVGPGGAGVMLGGRF